MDNKNNDELKKYEAELEQLKTVSRREIAEKIKAARALGDLSENSAYDEAKNEQTEIEARIHAFESILKNTKNTSKNESDAEDSPDCSDYVTTITVTREIEHHDKINPEDCIIDMNAKVILYALQSLGFYAEIADYRIKETGNYGTKEDVSVLLTNANEKEFLTLWDCEFFDEDQYAAKYDPVMGEVYFRCCENEDGTGGGWCAPSYVYEDGTNTITCGFDERHSYGDDVIVKINQPPKYNSDKVICFYSKGDYPQFSNFYPAETKTKIYQGLNPDGSLKIVDGKKYASVEHYFQIMKALEFDPDGEAFKQMGNQLTCKEIKSLGRKVQNFDTSVWNIRRRFHMRDAVTMKFWQNEELRELLLNTGDAVLAEASPRDTFWGIGYSGSNPKAHDPAQWRGRNVLGIMLMYLRDAIREEEQQNENS